MTLYTGFNIPVGHIHLNEDLEFFSFLVFILIVVNVITALREGTSVE